MKEKMLRAAREKVGLSTNGSPSDSQQISHRRPYKPEEKSCSVTRPGVQWRDLDTATSAFQAREIFVPQLPKFALLPRLEYSGTNTAHCSLNLPVSSNPPTSASQHFGKPQQAGHLRLGVRDQPDQHGETPSQPKIQNLPERSIKGQAQWLTPVIPPPWKAKSSRSGVRDQPGQHGWSAVAQSQLTATSASPVQDDSPASPSRVAEITDIGFCHVAQANAEELTELKQSTRLSLPRCWDYRPTREAQAEELIEPRRRRLQWAEITPLHSSLAPGDKAKLLQKKKKRTGRGSYSVTQAGVQQCNHSSLQLLPSRIKYLPTIASQVAGITGIQHQTQLFVFLVEMGFHQVAQVGLALLRSSDLLPQIPKVLGLQPQTPGLSHPPTSVSLAIETTCVSHHTKPILKNFLQRRGLTTIQSSLKFLTSGYLPSLASQRTRITATREAEAGELLESRRRRLRLACNGTNTTHCNLCLPSSSNSPTSASRTGFHHVGQAGLELLTSGDPPALASKVLGLQARGFTMLLFRRLRQESPLNLGGGDYSELRLRHCTPARHLGEIEACPTLPGGRSTSQSGFRSPPHAPGAGEGPGATHLRPRCREGSARTSAGPARQRAERACAALRRT
ncbi:hypothetical protein AAY473_029181 [Plecturocebus cupreus]